MKPAFLLLALGLCLNSCGSARSFHAAHRASAPQCCNYENAACHFEHACQSNPNVARNQNNLAAVSAEIGQWDKAFQAACTAVRLEENEHTTQTFVRVWNSIRNQHQIRTGLTLDDIHSRLGTPNLVVPTHAGKGCVLTYGLLDLTFENGVLIQGKLHHSNALEF